MFSIQWVVHRHENQPVEIENSALQDVDEVVESCQARFPEEVGAPQGVVYIEQILLPHTRMTAYRASARCFRAVP